jgi:hypothetical protein
MATVKYTIPANGDGTFQIEVVDRGEENCNNILHQAQRMGTVLQDERTGPDCDEVHEGHTDGALGGGGDSIV